MASNIVNMKKGFFMPGVSTMEQAEFLYQQIKNDLIDQGLHLLEKRILGLKHAFKFIQFQHVVGEKFLLNDREIVAIFEGVEHFFICTAAEPNRYTKPIAIAGNTVFLVEYFEEQTQHNKMEQILNMK